MGFSDYVKYPAAEGKEKHVPIIEVNGDTVVVTVGAEVAHPNTFEHHIKWIRLYGIKKDSNLPVDIAYLDVGPTLAHPKMTVELVAKDYKLSPLRPLSFLPSKSLSLAGAVPCQCSKAQCKAHCFVFAVPAINLFCLVFCA